MYLAQKTYLVHRYLQNNFPLIFSCIQHYCPQRIFKTISGTNFIFMWYITRSQEKCRAKNHNSFETFYEIIFPCLLTYRIFVQIIPFEVLR